MGRSEAFRERCRRSQHSTGPPEPAAFDAAVHVLGRRSQKRPSRARACHHLYSAAHALPPRLPATAAGLAGARPRVSTPRARRAEPREPGGVLGRAPRLQVRATWRWRDPPSLRRPLCVPSLPRALVHSVTGGTTAQQSVSDLATVQPSGSRGEVDPTSVRLPATPPVSPAPSLPRGGRDLAGEGVHV